MVYTNIKQKAKFSTGLSDISSLQLAELGNQLIPCKCNRCLANRASGDKEFAKYESIIRGTSGLKPIWGRGLLDKNSARKTPLSSRVAADREAGELRLRTVAASESQYEVARHSRIARGMAIPSGL